MNNSNNNNGNNNNNNTSSKVPQSLVELDKFFDSVSKGLDMAMAKGFEECALCKTIGERGKLCETCGKTRTNYASNVVQTTEEMWNGVNRIRDWAEKMEKESQK